MEVLASDSDWLDLMIAAKETPTWFINGTEDLSLDVATIAEYREQFPWVKIDVVTDAGQLLIYQKFTDLIPKIAQKARIATDG